MELIIGGAFQGKLDYAATAYAVTPDEVFACQGETIDGAARCVCHLERFSLACVQTGKKPVDVMKALDFSKKILISDDISCGVVPLDPTERLWREETGRLLSWLAGQADTVTRIFCGLPLRLKG